MAAQSLVQGHSGWTILPSRSMGLAPQSKTPITPRTDPNNLERKPPHLRPPHPVPGRAATHHLQQRVPRLIPEEAGQEQGLQAGKHAVGQGPRRARRDEAQPQQGHALVRVPHLRVGGRLVLIVAGSMGTG